MNSLTNLTTIAPTPSGRRLPVMQSIRDAAALNTREHTTFYVSAFLFQAWLAELSLANAAQMAEQPDPTKRSFQSGQARAGFQKYFGKATDAEFPTLYADLMEFAGCDDPLAAYMLEALFPLSIEHEITGQFISAPPNSAQSKTENQKSKIPNLRSTLMRLCDWLDSVLHLRVLQEWHLMPDCFDPDPQKRELAYLATNHRHFGQLSQESQVRSLIHLADAAVEQPHSPNWATFHQITASPPPAPRPWPTQSVDTAIVQLWPLVTRYGWSPADLLSVLAKVLPPADLSTCLNQASVSSNRKSKIENQNSSTAALLAYCQKRLSLRCPSAAIRGSSPSNQKSESLKIGICLLHLDAAGRPGSKAS